MPFTKEELDNQEDFREAVAAISYYQPELDLEIAKRIENDSDFFWATTHRGEELLELALARRKTKMSTNIYIYGGGSIQVGKSVGGLLIALIEDPTWDANEQLMFDFAELDRKLPYTQRGKRYLLDDVRNRLVGTGAKAEIQRAQGFMETNGKNAISLTLVAPEFHKLTALQYIIEVLGFCDEYSVAILKNRKETPIAWLKFCTDAVPNFETVYNLYDVEKHKFMLRMKLKGAGAGYTSGKVQQIHEEIMSKELSFESPKKLRRFITLNYDHWTQRIQDACYDELNEILFGEEAKKRVEITGVAPEETLDELLKISVFGWRDKTTRNLTIYRDAVGGLSSSRIGKDNNLSERQIDRILGQATREIGIAFEKYLAHNQPQLWRRMGGTSEPDLISEEHRFVVSCKVLYGDRDKKLDKAKDDSQPELAYLERGYNAYLIVFWADDCEYDIRDLKEL